MLIIIVILFVNDSCFIISQNAISRVLFPVQDSPPIVRSPLQKLKVLLPTLDKQTQIAIFLDTILHKTDIENSELDLLQKQRQHLLQRMFI